MPWTAADAKGKTSKADTPKKQQTWAKVANDALARCEKKGQGDCEARAIKQANAVVAQMSEAWQAEYDGWFLDVLSDTQRALITLNTLGLKSALESERKSRKEAEKRLKDPDYKAYPDEFVPLVEKSVRQDGTIPLKVMGPGWGNTGYYSREVLERDGPKMFPTGTKMFWDHQTDEELAARPEGSLRNLAAELTTDARWESGNVFGEGLYADAQVFSGFKDNVEELAPHIGVSILGWGKAKDGEAEGRKGPIIQEIAAIRSVDFVTMPGAGGQILQLFEAARRDNASQNLTGGNDMEALKEAQEAVARLEGELAAAKTETEEANTKVTEAEAEMAKVNEASLLREAKDFVSEKLAKEDLPDVMRTRLVDKLSVNPPVEDGKLDEKAYAEKITETVKADVEYLAKILKSGAIRGMGGSGDAGDGEEGQDKLLESYQAGLEAKGKSPEEAERLAKIMVDGR